MRLTATGFLGLGTTNSQCRLRIRDFPTNQGGLLIGRPLTLGVPLYSNNKPSLVAYAQTNDANTLPLYVG